MASAAVRALGDMRLVRRAVAGHGQIFV